MHLDERIYNLFYKGYEDRTYSDLERRAKFSRRVGYGSLIFYPIGFYLVHNGTGLSEDFAAKYTIHRFLEINPDYSKILLDALVASSAVSMAIHDYCFDRVESFALKRKKAKEPNEEDIPQIQRAGRIGRMAHEIGFASSIALISGMAVLLNPFMLAIVPVLPFLYKDIHRNYDNLYAAAVDYATGNKRKS